MRKVASWLRDVKTLTVWALVGVALLMFGCGCGATLIQQIGR